MHVDNLPPSGVIAVTSDLTELAFALGKVLEGPRDRFGAYAEINGAGRSGRVYLRRAPSPDFVRLSFPRTARGVARDLLDLIADPGANLHYPDPLSGMSEVGWEVRVTSIRNMTAIIAWTAHVMHPTEFVVSE